MILIPILRSLSLTIHTFTFVLNGGDENVEYLQTDGPQKVYLSERAQLACHLCQKLLKNHAIANLRQAHTSISMDFPHNTN